MVTVDATETPVLQIALLLVTAAAPMYRTVETISALSADGMVAVQAALMVTLWLVDVASGNAFRVQSQILTGLWLLNSLTTGRLSSNGDG